MNDQYLSFENTKTLKKLWEYAGLEISRRFFLKSIFIYKTPNEQSPYFKESFLV